MITIYNNRKKLNSFFEFYLFKLNNIKKSFNIKILTLSINIILSLFFIFTNKSYSQATNPDEKIQKFKSKYSIIENEKNYLIYFGKSIKNKKGYYGSNPNTKPFSFSEGGDSPIGHFWAIGSKFGKFDNIIHNGESTYWIYLVPADNKNIFFLHNKTIINSDLFNSLNIDQNIFQNYYNDKMSYHKKYYLIEYNEKIKRDQMYDSLSSGSSIDISDCLKIKFGPKYSFRIFNIKDLGVDYWLERDFYCKPSDEVKVTTNIDIPWTFWINNSYKNKIALLSYSKSGKVDENSHHIIDPVNSSGSYFELSMFVFGIEHDINQRYLNTSINAYGLPPLDNLESISDENNNYSTVKKISTENTNLQEVPEITEEEISKRRKFDRENNGQHTRLNAVSEDQLMNEVDNRLKNNFYKFLFETFEDDRYLYGEFKTLYKLNFKYVQFKDE